MESQARLQDNIRANERQRFCVAFQSFLNDVVRCQNRGEHVNVRSEGDAWLVKAGFDQARCMGHYGKLLLMAQNIRCGELRLHELGHGQP
jgi:hypothetical protein